MMRRLLLVLLLTFSTVAAAAIVDYIDPQNTTWEIDCTTKMQRIKEFTHPRTGVLITQKSEWGYYLPASVVTSTCP